MRFEQFDLPVEFVRRFAPVKSAAYERGLRRYLFDPYRLAFFRSMATADRLPRGVIWTIETNRDVPRLVAGEHTGAAHYVLTEVPRDETSATTWALPRSESLRQRIRRITVESILADLRNAPFPVHDGVIALLTARLNGVDTRR